MKSEPFSFLMTQANIILNQSNSSFTRKMDVNPVYAFEKEHRMNCGSYVNTAL